MAMTPTEHARRMLRAGYGPSAIAERTGLTSGYIQKIKQRDNGYDIAHNVWRVRNPDKIAAYRARQNLARRRRNTALGKARKPVPL